MLLLYIRTKQNSGTFYAIIWTKDHLPHEIIPCNSVSLSRSSIVSSGLLSSWNLSIINVKVTFPFNITLFFILALKSCVLRDVSTWAIERLVSYDISLDILICVMTWPSPWHKILSYDVMMLALTLWCALWHDFFLVITFLILYAL